MANPTRDPEKGKDVEGLTKGLEELCESPEEEESAKALLHSRLEQRPLIRIMRKKTREMMHAKAWSSSTWSWRN